MGEGNRVETDTRGTKSGVYDGGETGSTDVVMVKLR